MARVAAGNFLVLTLLCRHIRTDLPSGEVAGFLTHLATDASNDKLGFIYEQFWHRITARLLRSDLQVLCDVAGILVAANGPLTADVICEVLSIRAGDWDFAMRNLQEYLTILRSENGSEIETFYRIYHESFAEFLRARTTVDRRRYRQLLGDYCRDWSGHQGYGRLYALRFGMRNLLDDERWDELTDLLLDIFFLEAKAEAGLVFELTADLAEAARRMPTTRPASRIIGLLEQALRFDVNFVARHPTTLFQCFWNRGWWYDCPEGVLHYLPPANGWPPEGPPWERPEPRLFRILEGWRQSKEKQTPGFVWIRSLRPPMVHLKTAQRAVFRGHEETVVSVCFSPDSSLIASGSRDKTVRVWNVHSGAELFCLRGHEGGVTVVRFSPDGNHIISESHDALVVWDARSGTELLRHSRTGERTAYSQDFTLLVRGSTDNTVRVCNMRSGAELRCLRGHEADVTRVALSHDGSRIVSASLDKTVRVWDAFDGQELLCIKGLSWRASAVCFSPDGSHIVGGLWDGSVYQWDSVTGIVLHELRLGGSVSQVMYSQDGRFIVGIEFGDRNLSVWDAQSGDRLLQQRSENAYGLSNASFSTDGTRICASNAHTVRVWDSRCGELLGLRGHERNVRCVQFSPDGKHIVSGSDDHTVRLWFPTGDNELRRLSGHEGRINSVAHSRDRSRILTASDDKTIRVWDADQGIELLCLRGHQFGVLNANYSPDSRQIVSGSSDMRVWDANSGLELRCWSAGWEYRVYRVEYSEDGEKIVSASDDFAHTEDNQPRFDQTYPYQPAVRVWDSHCFALCETLDSWPPWTFRSVGSGPKVTIRQGDVKDLEVIPSGSSNPVAWFPDKLPNIETTVTWRDLCGSVSEHLVLIHIEGDLFTERPTGSLK